MGMGGIGAGVWFSENLKGESTEALPRQVSPRAREVLYTLKCYYSRCCAVRFCVSQSVVSKHVDC